MSSIEAKPTEYKGTLYRSRLEARWAVYLDAHPKIILPRYEPVCFPLASGTYTPDFYFFLKKSQGFYLEIKPSQPTVDYIENLLYLLTVHPISILLAVGSFYKEEPIVYELNNTVQHKDGCKVVGAHLSKIPGLGDPYALQCASGYRFDLAQPEAPRRKGHRNAQGPPIIKKRRRR